MTSNDIRKKFLDFFEAKGHKVLPSASLVPENDSSVLFTTAGMQQFKKLYSNPENAKDPRITTIQPCLRTSDIEEVGDESHLTFFEMLGNFSFGYTQDRSFGYPEKENSYFKEKAIKWAWEFLIEELGIEKNRISATYFDQSKSENNLQVDTDDESLSILKTIDGLNKIDGQGDDNFWSLGTENSPGGPTVEFYVDNIEIWNLVFNQYIYQSEKYIPSKYRGVDTGMGLERLAAVMQKKDDVYETDLFLPIIQEIEKLSGKKYQENKKAFRIITDHVKAVTFLLNEGILPSNKDQGYIARRLIRRSIVKADEIGIKQNFTAKIANAVFNIYSDSYFCHSREDGNLRIDLSVDPRLRRDDNAKIIEELEKEETKFRKTLSEGLKMFGDFYTFHIKKHQEDKDKIFPVIGGKFAFDMYQSYGFPLEMTLEEFKKRGMVYIEPAVRQNFNKEMKEHQEKSRTASAGMFKGGLADAGEETTKLHTAAHLMLAALRQVLGDQVEQKGSNITEERLRFDFNNPEKLTPEQIAEVEKIVNEQIEKDLPVVCDEMSIEEAEKSGAAGTFKDRYGEKVKVYSIGDFSKEICGGPHVERTGKLGCFEIVKEESSSAGIRRIKAILK